MWRIRLRIFRASTRGARVDHRCNHTRARVPRERRGRRDRCDAEGAHEMRRDERGARRQPTRLSRSRIDCLGRYRIVYSYLRFRHEARSPSSSGRHTSPRARSVRWSPPRLSRLARLHRPARPRKAPFRASRVSSRDGGHGVVVRRARDHRGRRSRRPGARGHGRRRRRRDEARRPPSPSEPAVGPIFVCTRNDALEGVIDATPRSSQEGSRLPAERHAPALPRRARPRRQHPGARLLRRRQARRGPHRRHHRRQPRGTHRRQRGPRRGTRRATSLGQPRLPRPRRRRVPRVHVREAHLDMRVHGGGRRAPGRAPWETSRANTATRWSRSSKNF